MARWSDLEIETGRNKCVRIVTLLGEQRMRGGEGFWEIRMVAPFQGLSQHPDGPCRVVSGKQSYSRQILLPESCHPIVN